MNRTDPSISVSQKSGFGIVLTVLSAVIILVAALFYGIYRYVSNVSGPESPSDQQSSSAGVEPSQEKSDKRFAEPTAPGKPSSVPPAPEPAGAVHKEPGPVGPSRQFVALDDSDEFVRGLLKGLSDRPEYLQWLTADQLIRKITMVTDNLSRGTLPAARIRHLAPQGQFSAIVKSPDRYVMNPKGYHRYDLYSDFIASVDISSGLRTYRTLKPLFDTAYRELGYPEGDFDDLLRRAIRHLLETPVLSGEIALVRPSVAYRFADPELESLSSAQKQLIRMGPKNTRVIQGVLRNVLKRLDQNDAQSAQKEAPEG